MKQKQFSFLATRFFLVFFLCGSSLVFSQADDDYEAHRDSAWRFEFDMSELDYSTVKMDLLTKKLARIKKYNDSIMMVVKMKNIKWRSDSLMQLYDLLNGDVSTSYNAYSFFAGQYHSNLSGLNKVLSAAGLPRLSQVSFHLTNFLDYTWKRKRLIHDIFVSDGMAQDVDKGNISVSYKFRSLANYSFGFCFIDSKRFQFFPFGGLSFQTSFIRFKNTDEQIFEMKTGSYDSLLYHSMHNTRGVEYEVRKRELVLNYGAELDLHLFYSKRQTGVVLGVRAANALPLIGSGWVFQSRSYSQLSNVTLKDYYYDLVVRIYFRTKGKRGTYDLHKNWWE